MTDEARTPEQTIREALDAALDCKGPYMGTVSERGGDRAICPQCTAVVHRARLELAELADLRAELAAAREAMVKADRSFESIIVRCTEGDKRVNWLPTITGIAREARAALGAAPASPAEAPQAEPVSEPQYPCRCGHGHMVGDDEGGDGGCRVCECSAWLCPCGDDDCDGCREAASTAEPNTEPA